MAFFLRKNICCGIVQTFEPPSTAGESRVEWATPAPFERAKATLVSIHLAQFVITGKRGALPIIWQIHTQTQIQRQRQKEIVPFEEREQKPPYPSIWHNLSSTRIQNHISFKWQGWTQSDEELKSKLQVFQFWVWGCWQILSDEERGWGGSDKFLINGVWEC